MKNLHQRSRKSLKLCLFILLGFPVLLSAQQNFNQSDYPTGKGPNDFPELVFTNIPGAPKLGKPNLIVGSIAPVIGEGMGWASPEVYDWDGDGKKDLLIGEFGSMMECKGKTLGNFVRVYRNNGTDQEPAFSGIFNYAYGKEEEGNGTPISVYTWCCLSFTPRIIDLDNDGYPDILTGQKSPGYVTWFRGSESGFLPGKYLKEAGDPRQINLKDYTLTITDTTSSWYWGYSAAAFGDFDGDDDADMIVGGVTLRLSKNIGTKTTPRFGIRKLLLDIDDKPFPLTGAAVVPYVVDWDGDGVLDLLVTPSYIDSGSFAVTFFRGIKTAKGPRFEHGVPLFTSKTGGKEFPGSYPNLCVTDWNNDGVKDLIIGTCVATLNGKFEHHLSWEWELEADTYRKNPAYYSLGFREMIKKSLSHSEKLKKEKGWNDKQMKENYGSTTQELYTHFYGKQEYMNLAHKGYVYVMLGQK